MTTRQEARVGATTERDGAAVLSELPVFVCTLSIKQLQLREAARHFEREQLRADRMAWLSTESEAALLFLERFCSILSLVERLPERCPRCDDTGWDLFTACEACAR